MQEALTLPFSSAVFITVGFIAFMLLLPFPFLWPWRLAKSRKRFARRGMFCLVTGLSAYALVACIAAVLLAIAAGMHDAGVFGNGSEFSPRRVFFGFGSFVTALLLVLVTVWVTDYFEHRWRELVARYVG